MLQNPDDEAEMPVEKKPGGEGEGALGEKT
jgi:hypothetical protein